MVSVGNVLRWVRLHRLKALATVFATGCVAIVGVVDPLNVYPLIRDWIEWRLPAQGVPADELTILISQFRSDPDGRYTSEIEAGLMRHGWESVRFRRTLTAEELIESSRSQRVSELETVAMLFERHGGDLLITGEVSASDDQVRIRLFEKGGSSALGVDVNLRDAWFDVLAPYVESAILVGLIRSGAYRADEYDDEFIRRVFPIESKAFELAQSASTEPVQEAANEVRRRLSIEIGLNLGDASRLTAAREESEARLSRLTDSDSVEDRIAAMWDVADLSRAEALAVGDMQLLDRSFVMSLDIRRLLEVPEDDYIYPDDFDGSADSGGALEIESSVALACRDLQRIDELLEIYERVAACATDRLDTACPAWSTRAIFALRYGRGAWSLSDVPSVYAAASVVDFWAQIVGYGRRTRHWADPMTHADRLLRARLGIGLDAEVSSFLEGSANATTLPSAIPGENACPNLIRLMVLPASPVQQ